VLRGQSERWSEVEWPRVAERDVPGQHQVEALDRHRLLSRRDEGAGRREVNICPRRDHVAGPGRLVRFAFEMGDRSTWHLLRVSGTGSVYDVYRVTSAR